MSWFNTSKNRSEQLDDSPLTQSIDRNIARADRMLDDMEADNERRRGESEAQRREWEQEKRLRQQAEMDELDESSGYYYAALPLTGRDCCPKCHTPALTRRIYGIPMIKGGNVYEVMWVACLHCTHDFLERPHDAAGKLTRSEWIRYRGTVRTGHEKVHGFVRDFPLLPGANHEAV